MNLHLVLLAASEKYDIELYYCVLSEATILVESCVQYFLFFFNTPCYVFVTDVPILKLALGINMNPADIEEGDDVYFECKIDANPPAYKVIWKHNVSCCRYPHINIFGAQLMQV